MREIKFRAWNTEKGRMSYQDGTGGQPLILKIDGALALVDKHNNSEYHYSCEDNLFITDEEGGKYHPEDFLLMQYTGLKDKNGKEIYEGDIVKVHMKGSGGYVDYEWDDDADPYDYFFNTEVVYRDGGYTYSENGSEFNYYVGNREQEELEVIGNIYENPELLSKLTTK